jgi:hypothetical protein
MTLSRFAGQYNAVEFNYGGIGSASPAALVVVSASNAASATGTITVQNGWFTMSDGTVVTPFNVNAPVSIVNASGVDTQTPSAVATNVQSSLYGLTATVTATTWTYAHAPGDRVSSGTVGLQEAINYASAKGGGTVIVDNGWVTQGGTTAILEAATVPAGVTILDLRQGNPLASITITTTLTNAQVLGMEAAPVQLVPAAGAGTLLVVNSVVLENLNTGTAYANGGVIGIYYGTTNQTYPASGTVAATFLTSPTAKAIAILAPGFTDDLSADALNSALSISNATAPFITGTGTLRVTLNYSVIAGM